jgi:hypothetical protein
MRVGILAVLLMSASCGPLRVWEWGGPPAVLHASADLSIGETVEVDVPAGPKIRVKLVAVREACDTVNESVRRAEVDLEVDGLAATIPSATYHLPRDVGSVQVDCPITSGYLEQSRGNPWGLRKDARLRFWPAGSSWGVPGTFRYPVGQRWFASHTQMANEPVFVDGGETPGRKEGKLYYHYGLDFGGAEGLVDVVAAVTGTVVSSGMELLPSEPKDTPAKVRYDVVYVRDDRNWYYRYSHLKSIEPDIRPGVRVRRGRKLGLLGKEGGSGGWSHLHFDITRKQPSGEWGIEDGYAFLWQAYREEHEVPLTAVARPHQVTWAGESVQLDATRSRGTGLSFRWTFSDGTTATGAKAGRSYDKPGMYTETLQVSDGEGRVDYDFCVVQVFDRARPDALPPSIHAAYSPTAGIRPKDPVHFKVRSFRSGDGEEIWDFGDGTPPARTKSDGNAVMHAVNGYADVVHRFEKPGIYLVSVSRSNAQGVKATARLAVSVEPAP